MLPITRRDNPVGGPGDIVGDVVLSVSAGQLRALRLRAQLLSGPPAIPVAEAADIGRFLGADVTLEKVET
jgi:hypothetical protein